MVALSLLCLPNAVLFALSYLIGSGFAIGTGTSVSLGASHVGAVPAFPLLAAVPAGRAPAWVVALCVITVVGAGVAVGWRIATRSGTVGHGAKSRADRLNVADQVRAAMLAAVGIGVAAAILVGFAGGPAGPGRLRAVGPSPWHVGITVSVELGIVAALVVLACSFVARYQPR